MAKEYSFSTLWGSEEVRATEDSQPFQSDAEARAARDLFAKFLKTLGVKHRRHTLSGQVRQYWAWGVPCGGCCNVYKIEVEA